MNEVGTVCIVYDGNTLATINVMPGENMNQVLSKINTAIQSVVAKQDVSGLDMGCIVGVDPLEATPVIIDQAIINKLCETVGRVTGIEADLAALPALIMGTNVTLDLRALTGVNNDCVPAAPIALSALLGMLVQQIQDLKKKDYTENSCDDECGTVLSASGAFVQCFAVPDATGDFDARDFFDQIYYADYPDNVDAP